PLSTPVGPVLPAHSWGKNGNRLFRSAATDRAGNRPRAAGHRPALGRTHSDLAAGATKRVRKHAWNRTAKSWIPTSSLATGAGVANGLSRTTPPGMSKPGPGA